MREIAAQRSAAPHRRARVVTWAGSAFAAGPARPDRLPDARSGRVCAERPSPSR